MALIYNHVREDTKHTIVHVEKNFENQQFYNGILETKYLNQSIFSYEILKQNYLLGVGTKNYLIACSGLKETSKNELIKEKVIIVTHILINFIMNLSQNMVFWEQ